MRVAAVLALVACLSGCFGYNRSAKRWAYAGNTVLVLGGGAAIAADVLLEGESTMTMPVTGQPQQDEYSQPISGGIVAGALLVSAGIVGIILNATRPDVKTSR